MNLTPTEQPKETYIMKARTKAILREPSNQATRLDVLGAGCAGASFDDVKTILVPIDFSDCSRTALRSAVSLASLLKASLVLLHVVETSAPDTGSKLSQLPDLEPDLRRLAKPRLAQLSAQEVPANIMSRSVIRAGRSDSEILDLAANSNVDLIVMATHSRDSRPGQLGTTAGRVASLATCPVLLVPVKEYCVPFFL